MKNILLSKRSKLITDILLIAALILMFRYTGRATDPNWTSSHCIIGTVSLILMIFHTWQHWPFIKALTRKKVIRKNKITTLTTISFLLISSSILLLVIDFNSPFLKFHNVVGHVVILPVIIHLATKLKRLSTLFKQCS